MKIGVIGGGSSGLVTSWLIEKKHDVILFEKEDKLGGHSDTLYLDIDDQKDIPIEIGWEFFNYNMYPHFNKLLSFLEIPIKTFGLTYSFYQENRISQYLLPPIIFKKFKIAWRNFLPNRLFNLMQMRYLLYKAKKLINSNNKTVTLDQFINSLWVTKSFINSFFYPFLSSGWGSTVLDFTHYIAWDVLSLAIGNGLNMFSSNIGLEIESGTYSYIKKLNNQLENTDIRLSSLIIDLIFDPINKKYIIIGKDQQQTLVDQIVIATDAAVASDLLKNIRFASLIRASLSKITYVNACVAVHADKKFMPKNVSDWSVINVSYNGIDSKLNIYKAWKSKSPIFRSWMPMGFEKKDHPDFLYSIRYYYHAQVDKNYFENQKFLETVQGENGLWFAGIYTTGLDIHESSIVSAINIAKKLSPESERLKIIS